jgi:hypothetical protein
LAQQRVYHFSLNDQLYFTFKAVTLFNAREYGVPIHVLLVPVPATTGKRLLEHLASADRR